jgi:hypothetical protein
MESDDKSFSPGSASVHPVLDSLSLLRRLTGAAVTFVINIF